MNIHRQVREALSVKFAFATEETVSSAAAVLDAFGQVKPSVSVDRLRELYEENPALCCEVGDWLYAAGKSPSYELALLLFAADRLRRHEVKDDLELAGKMMDIMMPVVNKRILTRIAEALHDS